ncbi:MAG: hypothetical protein CR993_05135 [Rhodobacterales bacterium]|nr:MAG: hypothetical protein CR993_05135 [Rhodobacterales bacterium]
MFKDWGFLISEMLFLIILAALLGLLVGWIIWGRRKVVDRSGEVNALQGKLKECEAARAAAKQDIDRLNSELSARDHAALAAGGAAAAVAADSDGQVDYDGDGVIEGADEGTRPETLSAARDGQPDDLKMIKGVGPKLEIMCNELGFYHFDQIANWTADEVAWVDANLEGFKGRVSRDNWVEQAKVLAAGGTTEFADRVKGGGVYE